MLRKPKTHRHYFKNSANQKYQSIFFQEIAQRKLLSYVYRVMFIVIFIPMYIFMFNLLTGFLIQKNSMFIFQYFQVLAQEQKHKKERKPLFLLPPI